MAKQANDWFRPQADGGTFTLFTFDKQQVKVRLAEMDEPEYRQPYGSKSKEKLSELIFGKDVRVVVQTPLLSGASETVTGNRWMFGGA